MTKDETTDLLSGPNNSIRAIWTTPLANEAGAPANRIIHGRAVNLPQGSRLKRLGLRFGAGYLKEDWLTDVRLLAWVGSDWKVIASKQNIPCPDDLRDGLLSTPLKDRSLFWIDLGNVETTAVWIEGRRCGKDRWWTGWALLESSLVLEGITFDEPVPQEFALLDSRVDIAHLPQGISAQVSNMDVRYKSRFLEIGFALYRPGMTYLAIDETGEGHTDRNLLAAGPQPMSINKVQGLNLHPIGMPELIGIMLRRYQGTMTASGSRVEYSVSVPDAGQTYQLIWDIEEEGLALTAKRIGRTPMRAWNAGIWQMVFDATVAVTSALGPITRKSQVGGLGLPCLVHAPGHGTLLVEADVDALWRFDAHRPLSCTTGELQFATEAQPEGDYLLPDGQFEARVRFAVQRFDAGLHPNAPDAVRRAVERCTYSSLTYRPDTATISNNACSIHAILCVDGWSNTTKQIGSILPNCTSHDFLRDTIQRYLDGGPGYGSETRTQDSSLYEDEFIHTGVSCIAAIGDYLETTCNRSWLDANWTAINALLAHMRKQDVDGDGIVESTNRLGISGQGQWSSNWWDVISFGWKDAWVNAILHGALRSLGRQMPELGRADLAADLTTWADSLANSYLPAFWNDATGRVAGWRSPDDKLHDYAFLFVNGAAVNSGLLPPKTALDVMQKLWHLLMAAKIPDFGLGLPGNLVPILPEDYAPGFAHPFGTYENGALTHSQSRHFVEALFRVGMTAEGDQVLERLCATLADCTAFGGCGTGVDWRKWDGSACGYEGMLTEQFGVLAVARVRWNKRGNGFAV